MRPFDIIDAPQRSPEWFKARAGRVTGSKAAAVLGQVKGGGENAARRDYRLQLVCERLTGEPQEDPYQNADMARGIELEPAARAAYEIETGRVVLESGFLLHRSRLIGCSLDGHCDDFAGVVELKCPRSATHLRYLREGIPADYLPQLWHALLVTGAAWADFASYDPRFPEPMRLCVYRLERPEADIEAYRAKLDAFLAEVDAEEQKLRAWRAR